MAEYVNTIDIKEDEEIFLELVTRSIVEFYDNVIQSVGNSAFNTCYELERVSIPNASTIGTHAFANCTKLSEVDISAATSIGGNAFFNAKMPYINLPNVTSIASTAFGDCINLTKVDIHTCEIRQNAFNKSAVNTVIIRGTTVAKLRANNVFANTPLSEGSGYIYVPATLIEDYKVATNWSVYADQFRAIEDYPDICG